uniref:Uncharacterized protein n=1 Tax=Glossina pallidipes TaxID=7398 RepID=A0A1B0AHZ6_GLOPL
MFEGFNDYEEILMLLGAGRLITKSKVVVRLSTKENIVTAVVRKRIDRNLIVSSDVDFTKPNSIKDNLEFDQSLVEQSDIKDHINDIRISDSKENHIEDQTTIEKTCLAMKNHVSF